MQIVKETCIDWHKRKLINEVYMDQGETRRITTGRGVKQECCLSQILFNLYSEYLNKEALEGFEVFETGGQVIRTVKYEDDLVLLAKKETVLQDMIDRLI